MKSCSLYNVFQWQFFIVTVTGSSEQDKKVDDEHKNTQNYTTLSILANAKLF